MTTRGKSLDLCVVIRIYRTHPAVCVPACSAARRSGLAWWWRRTANSAPQTADPSSPRAGSRRTTGSGRKQRKQITGVRNQFQYPTRFRGRILGLRPTLGSEVNMLYHMMEAQPHGSWLTLEITTMGSEDVWRQRITWARYCNTATFVTNQLHRSTCKVCKHPSKAKNTADYETQTLWHWFNINNHVTIQCAPLTPRRWRLFICPLGGNVRVLLHRERGREDDEATATSLFCFLLFFLFGSSRGVDSIDSKATRWHFVRNLVSLGKFLKCKHGVFE